MLTEKFVSPIELENKMTDMLLVSKFDFHRDCPAGTSGVDTLRNVLHTAEINVSNTHILSLLCEIPVIRSAHAPSRARDQFTLPGKSLRVQDSAIPISGVPKPAAMLTLEPA